MDDSLRGIIRDFFNSRVQKKSQRLINDISEHIAYLENKIEELTEKLHEYSLQEEVAKRDKEIEDLRSRSLHLISDREKEDIDKFRESHKGCDIRFIIGQTGGLGTTIIMRCLDCGLSKNITDTSNW